MSGTRIFKEPPTKCGLGSEARRILLRVQDLLSRDDVDGVTIATPDFSHGAILTATLKTGKDFYIEKPMTIDLASANRALDLAQAHGLVVHAGTQRRSEGRFIGAAKLYATGILGEVSRVSAITGATYPNSVAAHGGVYVWNDGRHTSDTFHALLEYPEGCLFDSAWGSATQPAFISRSTAPRQPWTSKNGAYQRKDAAIPAFKPAPYLSAMTNRSTGAIG